MGRTLYPIITRLGIDEALGEPRATSAPSGIPGAMARVFSRMGMDNVFMANPSLYGGV